MSADTSHRDASQHFRPDDAPSPDALRATVVSYEHSPDRCTVAPTDVDEANRLTTWLSVDASMLRPLDEMR